VNIGKNVWIGPFCYIRGQVEIGSNVWIGPGVKIHGEGGVTISCDVGIGSGAVLLTGEHDHRTGEGPIKDRPLLLNKITIQRGADIGVNAVILGGAVIGRNAIVGAGTVVPKNEYVVNRWMGIEHEKWKRMQGDMR
jgi:acetyltransferase-like isoleucine patch superfamily enzyme